MVNKWKALLFYTVFTVNMASHGINRIPELLDIEGARAVGNTAYSYSIWNKMSKELFQNYTGCKDFYFVFIWQKSTAVCMLM